MDIRGILASMAAPVMNADYGSLLSGLQAAAQQQDPRIAEMEAAIAAYNAQNQGGMNQGGGAPAPEQAFDHTRPIADPADVRNQIQATTTGVDPVADWVRSAGTTPQTVANFVAPGQAGHQTQEQYAQSAGTPIPAQAGNDTVAPSSGDGKVVIHDKSGKRVFRDKAAADAFLAEKAKAANEFANAQENVNTFAMMRKVARHARMGELNPQAAAITQVGLANYLKPTDSSNVDADGNPTAEFTAKNPQAAKVLAEANYMRGLIANGEKNIDAENLRTTTFAGVENTRTNANIRNVDRSVSGQEKIAAGNNAADNRRTDAQLKGVESTNAAQTQQTQIGADASRANTQATVGGQVAIAKDTNQANREISAGNNATAININNTSQAEETKRAGIFSQADVEKVRLGTASNERVAQIDADVRKHGINQDTAVRMREAGITEKMNNDQFNYLHAKLGVDKDAIEKDYNVRMKVADSARDEWTQRYQTELALGMGEIDARNKATQATADKYGQDFVMAGQEMGLRMLELDHRKYMDKEQHRVYTQNQAMIRKTQDEGVKLDKRKMALTERQAVVENRLRQLEQASNSYALGVKARNEYERLQMEKATNDANIAMMEQKKKESDVALEKATIDNKNMAAQADRLASDERLFSKSAYPEVSDRLTARSEWIAKNAGNMNLSGDTVPPAIAGYLKDLKQNGEELFDKKWTDDDTEFRQYAQQELAAVLGDDRLATKLVNKYQPASYMENLVKWPF